MEVKVVFCLLWISVHRISSLEDISRENTQDVVTDADVDFERLENDYAVGNVSARSKSHGNTTAVLELAVVSTEIPQTNLNNVTEFRASVHLGEIQESGSDGSNPFNKLSHLKFDNVLSVQPVTQNWFTEPRGINKESNYFNKKNIVDNANLTPPKPSFFPTASFDNENRYFSTDNNAVHFPQVPPSFQTPNSIPTGYQGPLEASYLQKPKFPVYNLPDKSYYESYAQEALQPFDTPGPSFPESPFNEVPNFDYVKQPSLENYEEPNGLRIHSEIRDILPTKIPQFPYKFYHGTPSFLENGLLEYNSPEEHVLHNVPRARRLSPWKKIVHLIGTILPFGLLLATLTPNIIQISNSTQSTIPLSKLKDVDLPPEHKSLRMVDDQIACEEKNICEVILAGSKPRSNLLQNILWNFVTRTSEETAKDNGLRELFQAVKNRDCNSISC